MSKSELQKTLFISNLIVIITIHCCISNAVSDISQFSATLTSTSHNSLSESLAVF